MFRRLLTLLVALPLLLPQGVCVCDFMQNCEACADCAGVVEPEQPTTCGCRKHKHLQASQNAAPSISPSHTCHKPFPTDRQDNHAPCCPAKEGSAVWKADTTQSVPALTLDLLALVSSVDALPAATIHPAPSIHFYAADRPIYLTTLSLRI